MGSWLQDLLSDEVKEQTPTVNVGYYRVIKDIVTAKGVFQKGTIVYFDREETDIYEGYGRMRHLAETKVDYTITDRFGHKSAIWLETAKNNLDKGKDIAKLEETFTGVVNRTAIEKYDDEYDKKHPILSKIGNHHIVGISAIMIFIFSAIWAGMHMTLDTGEIVMRNVFGTISGWLAFSFFIFTCVSVGCYNAKSNYIKAENHKRKKKIQKQIYSLGAVDNGTVSDDTDKAEQSEQKSTAIPKLPEIPQLEYEPPVVELEEHNGLYLYRTKFKEKVKIKKEERKKKKELRKEIRNEQKDLKEHQSFSKKRTSTVDTKVKEEQSVFPSPFENNPFNENIDKDKKYKAQINFFRGIRNVE